MQVRSYISPKVSKGAPSSIQGRGLLATQAIAQGEIVAIKGGHLIDADALAAGTCIVGPSDIKIADGIWIAAVDPAEYEDVMLFLNHSCEPNVGVGGNIIFVAMRDIAVGEELTTDYALFDDDDARMDCHSGRPTCRGIITGRDWHRRELQEKYGSYFSWYLQQKIVARSAPTDGSFPPAAT